MSRISKKKLIKILKGEEENPSQLFDKEWVEGLYNEGDWIKGYKRWKKQMDKYIIEHTLSTPLSEYEAIEKIGKKNRRRKNNADN
jgi:hypothetical protein